MTSDETTRSTTVGLIERIDARYETGESLQILLDDCRDELAKQAERVAALEAALHFAVKAIDCAYSVFGEGGKCGRPMDAVDASTWAWLGNKIDLAKERAAAVLGEGKLTDDQ